MSTKTKKDRDVLKIKVPPPVQVSAPTVIRLRPEDAMVLAELQTRTGRSASELAGILIRWAAERVVIETE